MLKKKVDKLEEAKQQIREQELIITNLQFTEREIQELRSQFSGITGKMFDYEKQITFQTQEADRLHFSIKRLT